MGSSKAGGVKWAGAKEASACASCASCGERVCVGVGVWAITVMMTVMGAVALARPSVRRSGEEAEAEAEAEAEKVEGAKKRRL